MGLVEEDIIWRPVNYKDYGLMYEVSRYGEIRRRDSKTLRHRCLHKKGYWQVSLSLSAKTETVFVHRLVALTFLENPDPTHFTQVHHRNSQKTDNTWTNLCWVDPLTHNHAGNRIEKQLQTLAEKRDMARRKKRGKKVQVCILRPQPDGGVSGETFSSIAEACRKTGAKRQDIKAVCEGTRRTAKGYRWVFAYSDEELTVILKDPPGSPEDVSETVGN